MNIVVIGAGTMGQGIAQTLAMYDNKVFLIDNNENQKQTAFQNIQNSVQKFVKKGQLTESQGMQTILNLNIATPLEQLTHASVELVIEAVFENLEVKKDIFKKLSQLFNDATILATNTSSISISKVAENIPAPDRIIGMHFMNPVPLMKLVEIITTKHTSEKTLQKIILLTEQLQKCPCVVKDFPGFIANRILMPMLNEAFLSLQQGIATIETIDTICKLGFGHPMGPLQLADFIGLDICCNILNIMAQDFNEPKYKPATILTNLVANGHLGKKTNLGFYNYSISTNKLIPNEAIYHGL